MHSPYYTLVPKEQHMDTVLRIFCNKLSWVYLFKHYCSLLVLPNCLNFVMIPKGPKTRFKIVKNKGLQYTLGPDRGQACVFVEVSSEPDPGLKPKPRCF